jgi:hypothetical protein
VVRPVAARGSPEIRAGPKPWRRVVETVWDLWPTADGRTVRPIGCPSPLLAVPSTRDREIEARTAAEAMPGAIEIKVTTRGFEVTMRGGTAAFPGMDEAFDFAQQSCQKPGNCAKSPAAASSAEQRRNRY